jgi:uncharacterized protein
MAHVVVTGASSGIGAAFARHWLQRGDRVTLVARRRNLLDELATGGSAHVIAADLADPASVDGVLQEAERAFGAIDVLVNNAGVQIVAPAEEQNWERAEALLRLDLHTPLRLIQAALPAMLARGSGTIVNVASMAAIAPTPGMLFYNAAKAGLAAASEALRSEVAARGVRVVTVYPGPVTSAMEAAAREAYEASSAMNRVPTGHPDVLAALVARAVDRNTARVIYPGVYGLARMFPGTTRWFMDRFTPKLKALPA